MIYVTLKMRLICTDAQVHILEDYQIKYEAEVRRLMAYYERNGTLIRLCNLSDYVSVRSKPMLVKDAKRYLKKGGVQEKIMPSFHSASYQLDTNRLRVCFGKAFQVPYLDLSMQMDKPRNFEDYILRTLHLKWIDQEIYAYVCALREDKQEWSYEQTLQKDCINRI